jgi:hypothetical protein
MFVNYKIIFFFLSDIIEDFLMMEMYDNYDPKKKSSFINEDGGIKEHELHKRKNSRVSEYSIGYCPVEGRLSFYSKTQVGNIGRCFIIYVNLFICLFMSVDLYICIFIYYMKYIFFQVVL